ncbi:hypothetical protein G8770_06050 [Aestuariicella hydrocarbonica]|uniref:Capsule polysaccharide biosynthesis protein n=1 Tax=Pseudomaricurvus hydrocarbonicus TaxID=1470433 RepID=A0A9E5JZ48_9GAMM|nr:hypothetical protein [Aestuariicella hydrocarbonica]
MVFYIDNLERYGFFSRFFDAITGCGYRVSIITASYSVYFKSRLKKIDAHVVSDVDILKFEVINQDWSSFHEVKAGYQDESMASKLYTVSYCFADRVFANRYVKKCFIFNGSSSVAKAIADCAKDRSVETLFFELANIPGKIFIDPEGVNAKSLLYKNIGILDEVEVDYEEFERWKSGYLSSCLRPKQAALASKFRFEYLIDWVGFCFFRVLDQSNKSYVSRGLSKVMRKSIVAETRDVRIVKPYLLFPCQVNNDTQLTLNSSIGNIEGIKIASEMAKSASLELLVKLHPAETDVDHVRDICHQVNYCDGTLLSKGDTLELVYESDKVVTINSSVGLMAVILGKDVEFLGESIYSQLTGDRLSKFIIRYLLDVDYFSKEDLSIEITKSFFRSSFESMASPK